MDEKQISALAGGIIHPETGEGLAVKNVEVSPGAVKLTIVTPRSRDPFAASLKREAAARIENAFPGVKATVFIEEPPVKPVEKKEPQGPRGIPGVGCIIAVASGKGGVGKSTVAASLAATLAEAGYRTGLLDADIYGPSQPALFGVEGFRPETEIVNGQERITPASARGVKLMSIAFFINPGDALVWRGPMATSALRQLVRQTDWGGLDFLLIDLPPGTGDVHLTILQEVKVDGAIVVTTPQRIALADVERGMAMFRAEKIAVPVLGIVENMAWFTPAEHPEDKYYIFGKDGAEDLARKAGVGILGRIPLVVPKGMAPEGGVSWNVDNHTVSETYKAIAKAITKNCRC